MHYCESAGVIKAKQSITGAHPGHIHKWEGRCPKYVAQRTRTKFSERAVSVVGP